MGKNLNLRIEAETSDVIHDLARRLNAEDTPALLRKALALLRLAADLSEETNGVIEMKGKGTDKTLEIDLRN